MKKCLQIGLLALCGFLAISVSAAPVQAFNVPVLGITGAQVDKSQDFNSYDNGSGGDNAVTNDQGHQEMGMVGGTLGGSVSVKADQGLVANHGKTTTGYNREITTYASVLSEQKLTGKSDKLGAFAGKLESCEYSQIWGSNNPNGSNVGIRSGLVQKSDVATIGDSKATFTQNMEKLGGVYNNRISPNGQTTMVAEYNIKSTQSGKAESILGCGNFVDKTGATNVANLSHDAWANRSVSPTSLSSNLGSKTTTVSSVKAEPGSQGKITTKFESQDLHTTTGPTGSVEMWDSTKINTLAKASN